MPVARCLFLCLITLLCFASCGEEPPVERPAEELPPSELWYILEEGVPKPRDYAEVQSLLQSHSPDRPWTVQERPTGFIRSEHDLFIGINRHGLLRVLPGSGDGPAFEPIFNPEVFGGRTLGALFRSDGRTWVHVYVNPILGGDDLTHPGENIYRISENPGEVIPRPMGRDVHAWELTDVITSREGWRLLWRETGSGRDRVEYEARRRPESPGKVISAEEFRSSYEFTPLHEAPSPYRDALAMLRDMHPEHRLVVHAAERDTGAGGRRYYREGDITTVADEGTLFVTLPAVKEGERRYILLPGAPALLIGTESSGTSRIDLPPPGRQAFYTDLQPLSGGILLTWEQKNFSRSGRSGLLFLPLM